MLFERIGTRALTLALLVACDRGHREPQRSAPLATPPTKSAGACSLAALPTRVPLSPKRIVAIGDLHGDLDGARAALRTAGAIDDQDRWSGGDLVVVQVGDILDRGNDESKIFALLERLDAEARTAGGAVIYLLGNHELMNAARDYRYVTPDGMHDFGGDRTRALDPGGTWAKHLAQHNVVAIINGNVFSHAGVIDEWTTRVDDVNLASRCWLDGQSGGPEARPLALDAEDSPVWTRAYGIDAQTDCGELDRALAHLGAKRMIIGHTVQEQGITSRCDGKLWRVDVGLAKLYGGPIEVLEIADQPRVLHGHR